VQLGKSAVLCGVSLAWTLSCRAGETGVQNVPTQAPQIMLYFHQPVGGHGGPRVYGLRIDQTSVPASSAVVALGNPLRRREILDLEFAPHSDLRVAFGRRLIWNLGTHEFGLYSRTSSVAALPLHLPAPALAVQPLAGQPLASTGLALP